MENLEENLAQWVNSQLGHKASLDRIDASFFFHQLDRISAALSCLNDKNRIDVLFFSHRPEYFDKGDLESLTTDKINSVTFCSNRSSLLQLENRYDIAIVCTHINDEQLAQLIIRARNMAGVIVAWTWDNHHHEFENVRSCCMADIVIPAHDFCADKLYFPFYILGKSVPLCTGQWARDNAEEYLSSTLNKTRSNALSGGYIMWDGSARNRQLRKLRENVPDNELELIEETERGKYFQMNAKERFNSWSSYKVSLQIPYAGDLSLRVFDALITGQIPIVPRDCHDLNHVIPPSVQKLLPIIRVEDISTPSIIEAWKEGIKEFDRMGIAGILERHNFAREHHHITSRVEQIIGSVGDLSKNPKVKVRVINAGVGLVLDA